MMLRVICQKFCATRSGPTYANGCSGKSADVTTALTPGNAAAFAISIERMRAWACGERRMRPTSMPGIARSAPYCARPVTFGTPSGRTGRVPTHLNCFAVSLAVSMAVTFVATSVMGASPDRRIAEHDGRAAGAQMQAIVRGCEQQVSRLFVSLKHGVVLRPARAGGHAHSRLYRSIDGRGGRAGAR